MFMVSNPATGLERSDAAAVRHPWLSSDVLARIRTVLLAGTLFFGLAVYVYHTIAARPATDPGLLQRLRVLGLLTWLYAMVQMIDMRFYNSRFAQKRRDSMRIPDSLHGWLFGQMLASYGIIYYAFAEDLRWYVGGLVILALSFAAFPITRR
jgi:hypothetical protein